MTISQYLTIEYDGKEYQVNKDKLFGVLSVLEGKCVVYSNDEELRRYLNKYEVYDEVFLEGVNEL